MNVNVITVVNVVVNMNVIECDCACECYQMVRTQFQPTFEVQQQRGTA